MLRGGKEHLETLRDGRVVYVGDEKIDDVTAHPAFRNAAASIALLYDALHDAKTKDVLTAPTDTGSGGYTHKFFKAARSRDDVVAQRDAIAAWAMRGWRQNCSRSSSRWRRRWASRGSIASSTGSIGEFRAAALSAMYRPSSLLRCRVRQAST